MRQSNIELCRIITMMLVLTVHSSFATFGGPAEWDKPYYGLIVAQCLSVVGVNVFVLISGYFSIKLKKQSLLRLLFCCLFYAIVSSVYSFFNHSFSFRHLLFVSEANWFIAAYIGLMLLSPILNAFLDNSSKKELGLMIVILLLFQTWYEFVPKLIPDFHAGYSILSFCILYLIARYLKLYINKVACLKKCFICYITISIFLALSIVGVYASGYKVDYLCGSLLKYNQPIVIFSSVCLFVFFASIKIPYKSYINHIAKSCIAVLLIHTSYAFNPCFSEIFRKIYNYTSGLITVLIWILAVIIIFITCAVFDQIRIIIENRILPKK